MVTPGVAEPSMGRLLMVAVHGDAGLLFLSWGACCNAILTIEQNLLGHHASSSGCAKEKMDLPHHGIKHPL